MVEVLIIDNFDSFTYNLFQYVGELNTSVIVKRNKITLKEIEKVNPERIIISPGPGRPEDGGISIEAVKRFTGKIPILGVCLGHQAIGHAFGAKIIRAEELLHGKTSLIKHDGADIFKGVKNPFTATRYHSLVIDRSSLPEELAISAVTMENKTIMAIRHINYPTFGVQFHPESILTSEGRKIIKNFLDL